LEKVQKHPDLELQIAIAASAILPQYGNVEKAMEKDGFTYDAKITMTLAGGNSIAMAKTTGIGIMEFATVFDNLKPDIVVVRGDRYEVMAAAIAAGYMNISIAHIEGGDTTGNIDESVRHAVTKLAHIHFITNEESGKRVRQMGENPNYIFHVGCPELEYAQKHNSTLSAETINRMGVGAEVDLLQPFIIVMHHPVTSETGQNREHTNVLLKAVQALGVQTLWFWPNIDAGTDEVAKAIRIFREHENADHMRFLKYMMPEDFMTLLKHSACLVGNSSAGIKEASYLGLPTVNIGSRQQGRTCGENVTNIAQYDEKVITTAISTQLEHGKFEPCFIYYKEHCSKNITDTLASVDLYTQKEFYNS
jgi:UDP-hydrolysing UDP-N-acetyl-D-glucosamine 2-epimerase